MNWVLRPFQGIGTDGITVSFGDSRAHVRESLAAVLQLQNQNEAYPDEDDFKSGDGSTFIRIRYDDDDDVWDIEFIAGTLRYEHLDLHDNTSLEELKKYFLANAMPLRTTEWLGDGWDCVALGVNIASHDDIGGDGDEIEWVIMSRAFQT